MSTRETQVKIKVYKRLLYINNFICSTNIIIIKENKTLIDNGKAILSIKFVMIILLEDFVK